MDFRISVVCVWEGGRGEGGGRVGTGGGIVEGSRGGKKGGGVE